MARILVKEIESAIHELVGKIEDTGLKINQADNFLNKLQVL